MDIIYIWRSSQTEPGLSGSAFAATTSKEPPPEIQQQPVPGSPGLVYQESAYSAWELVGSLRGECWLNKCGEHIVLAENGRTYTAQEAAICGIMKRA